MRNPTPFPLSAGALAALLGLAALTACGSGDTAEADTTTSESSATAGPVTVTDDTDVEVSLDEPATRVACLTMICVDALTEVGITPVAYREPLALDERFAGPDADMREITGGFGEENVEDVVLSDPDLVIGLAGAQDGLREAVEVAAPLYLVDPRSWEDSVAFLRTVGELTDTSDAAEERAATFETLVEDAAAERSDLTTLSMYGEPGSLGVDSVETPVGSLLAEVSDYPWEAGDDPFASIAVEQIAEVDPDVVFAQAFSAAGGSEPLVERLATDPQWAELSAAQNDRVVEVEAELWATGRGTISLTEVLATAQDALASDG